MKAETGDGIRWMFQDVHPGGVAAQAEIHSGDVLLKIGDKDLRPLMRCGAVRIGRDVFDHRSSGRRILV